MLTKWIQFIVKPNLAGAFQAELRQLEEASSLEAGCVYYAAFRDESHAGLFTVLESWEDAAALEAHRETPHVARFKANGAAMILEKSALSLAPLRRSPSTV